MRNIIIILFLFIISVAANAQWYYGSGKAVNLENDIGYQKNTQLIKSGVTADPQTASTTGGAGSLILKTDGNLYVKKDAGSTTNWKKLLDETTNLLTYIPTASSTQTGVLTSGDWSTFNGKENVLSFSSPLSRTGDTVSIPPATTATSGYLESADWNTFNDKIGSVNAVSPIVINQLATTATFSIPVATTATDGYLAATDWTIFDNKQDDISTITKEVTGFTTPADVVVTYDPATRKVTLTGDTSALAFGKAVTNLPSGWVSDAHAASEATWFLSYDPATATASWSNTPWTFDKMQIAIAFEKSFAHFGLREPHGQMQFLAHKNLHETVGSYLGSGGDFSSYVLNSSTAANRRPDISSLLVNDEDVPTTLPALTTKLYTQFTLTGATSLAAFNIDAAEIVPVLAARPYYNQFTGGAWQQTLMTNNAYQAIFVLAVPVSSDADSQKYRFQFIQGQSESTTLATIQSLTPSSVNLNGFVGSLPEFVFVGKIIIRYLGPPTNNWQLISVEKLTGSKVGQSVSTGNWLSSVSSSAEFTGDGTISNPLTLSTSISDALWTATGTSVYRSGKVGIGNTDPLTELHVTGDTTFTAYNYIGLPDVDGSYRTYIAGPGAFVMEKREAGVWVEIYRLE